MSLSKIMSYGLIGLSGFQVDVEIDVSRGKSSFEIVGLPDNAVKESKDRVCSAIVNSGFVVPDSKITVNLAPASMKKEGSSFDLAIAIGILSATSQILHERPKNFVFLGELSLDGTIRHLEGILPMLISAKEQGHTQFILSEKNSKEASFIEDVEVFSLKNLRDVADFLCGNIRKDSVEKTVWSSLSTNKTAEDFSRVKGQSAAKRAIEIAVSGGHNILMVGPPGSGKTLLAKCVPSILPDLTFEEALEITKIHSVAGILDSNKGIVVARPFRSPHHTASTVALTGGGRNSKPGEISLAHNGVLFLDEMPEYPRSTLETLRQPLEDGVISISRIAQTVQYPANFILVASMNPCPCGNFGSKDLVCTCSPNQIHKYLSKISGPLLDRIDLKIDVDRVKFLDIHEKTEEETSAEVKKRVDKAREIQLKRFKDEGIFCNAKMNNRLVKKYCDLDDNSSKILQNAFDKFHMSARGYTRILKVARTIADLDNSDKILTKHILEAIAYRNIDKLQQV